MLNKIFSLTIGALLFCLLLILSANNKDFEKHNDPHEYANIGQNLWNCKGILYDYKTDVILPPGFPAAIGLANLFIDNPAWSGKIVSVIAFLISLFIVYKVSLGIIEDKKYSQLSVVLFATNSNILINASNGYSESLFTAIFLLLVWMTLVITRQKRVIDGKLSIAFAFMWAWLYYIRPEGLIVGAILFYWFVLRACKLSQLSWFVPVVTAILIYPYLFFLKEYTGRWQLSGKTYVNLVMGELRSPYRQNNKNETISERFSIIERTWETPPLAKGFTEYWFEPENDISKRISVNLLDLGKIFWFTFSVFGLVLGILGLIAMKKDSAFFLLTLLIPIGIYLIFFVLHRTVAVYHWIWILFIVTGLKNLNTYLESRFSLQKANFLIKLAVVILIMYQIRSAVKIAWDLLG